MLNKDSKKWLIETLMSWDSTFESDAESEDYDNSDLLFWNATIGKVVRKIESDTATIKDYEEIIFQLYQKFTE
jgi:hypothetical protein